MLACRLHQRAQHRQTVVGNRASCFLSQQDLALRADHDEPLQLPRQSISLPRSSIRYDTGADRYPARFFGEVLLCLVLLLAFSHHEPGYARTVHLVHLQRVLVQDDFVADLGGAAQSTEDEAADSLKVLALELRV